MASTYSDLKIELIGTGEQSGTWGATTNTNLGTAIQEAITGSANVAFSGADVTITLTDTNASQAARNLRLNLTGTSGGARNLILGSGCQIEKLYLINNGLSDTVTVKNTTGTGVAVASGKSTLVYNDGTNVVEAITTLPATVNLTSDVTGTLPVANGGTGITSLGAGVATWLGTPSSANLASAVTDETGSGALVFANTPTLVSPVLGTPTSGNLENCTNFPVAEITGLGSNVGTFLETPSSSNLAAAVTDETGTGALVFANTPTLVAPVLGTPTSGTLSNCTVDGTDAVGFRNTPVLGKTANYTLVLSDAGKTILHELADNNPRTFTIPSNASVAYPIGTIITFVNLRNTLSIAITSDTMYLAPDGTTGTRTLGVYGMASAMKVGATTWIISGNGLG